MSIGSRYLKHVFVALLVFFFASPAGAGGGSGGGGTTGPDDTTTAPEAPTFSGVKIISRPCRFKIVLSAVDAEGDVDFFTKLDGSSLPRGFGLSGNKIDGDETCDVGTWTSSWTATDEGGLTSPASSLTLQCKTGTNSAPTAPTYSGTLVQTAPCSFAVTPVSGDADGNDVAISIANASCLPPGHTFSNGSIVGGTTSEVNSWTCTFTADDGKCEALNSSSVTLQCEAPPPAVEDCVPPSSSAAIGSRPISAFDACCLANPSDPDCDQ